MAQFNAWFREARDSNAIEMPEAMCLSTIDKAGFPDARMVLLKGFDASGFVFYTNTRSVKGRQLAVRDKAALTFYWGPLERQVRIQGIAAPVSDAEADAYFQTRARDSRIGAWASDQSAPLKNRKTLDDRFASYVRKFEGKEVPRPPHWAGYRIKPTKFEFWQGRPNRLHDRFLYVQAKGWKITRLYP